MAGNVKEWCANAVANLPLRYTLGGAWNEPGYRFRESDARDPWARDPTLGVRLTADVTPGGPELAQEVATLYGDPASLVPAGDDVFRAYTRFYDYDRSPLDAKVEAVDDSSPHWRREKVSYRAAYGDERIPAYVFLPKNATPPYQTVVLFPTSYARDTASSEQLDYGTFDFIIRSGRALIYPVYQDTFERDLPTPTGTAAVRDLNVQWAKDVMRSVDYLVTRPDVDRDRIGYFSVSLGAFFGPIPVALDTRFRAAVFAAGGLRFRSGGHPIAPEIQTAHFMPRIKAPVLIINGRDDFSVPEAAQQRFYELVGSPPGQKKVVRVEGGHVPADMLAFFREVLGWFDRWLGEVK
jgi:dienelactone hydrolase